MSSASFFSSSTCEIAMTAPVASTYGVGRMHLHCRYVKRPTHDLDWLAVSPLNRERILKTAVRIADREGPDAVTLRRIAAELDVHVTSLYNHVPTRDAVTDGIVELLLDEAKLPTGPVSWEAWVQRFFEAIGTIATTHPGAFMALQYRPVQGPRAAASFEVALAAFTRAGFTPADAYAAVKTVSLLALA